MKACKKICALEKEIQENKIPSIRLAILHIDAPLECLKARVAVRTYRSCYEL